MSLSAAKSRVLQATTQIESGRLDDVEPTLAAAEGFLAGLPAAESAPVVAQIADVRAQLREVVMPDDARMISAAQGKLRQARSSMKDWAPLTDNNRIDIDGLLAGAVQFLDQITDPYKADALRAPVLAEIAEVRTALHAVEKAIPVPAAAAAPAAVAAPAVFAQVKSRIIQVRSAVESGRTEGADGVIDEAIGLLAGVPAEVSADLLAQLSGLRVDLAGAIAAERARRIDEQLNRHLSAADNAIIGYPDNARDALARFTERFAADDVRVTLSVAAYRRYETWAAEVGARLAGTVKDNALSRALPLLRELEDMVATDPFAGLDQQAANRRAGELHSLRSRVTHELDAGPQRDPDILAAVRRIEATDVMIAVADAAWARAGLYAEVQHFWDIIKQEIDGWAEETTATGPLAEPDLPKTRLAIQRVAYLLADPKTHQIRDDNVGDAIVESTYREADEVFAAAAAKMAAAFGATLDEADRMPVPAPESTFELDKPRLLAGAAERSLAGTPYLDAVVARARGLDARWQAEVAAVRQAREDLYDKLAVEADAAWPGIVSATGATADVDLTDVGRAVLIRGHNRSGWDFHGGSYPFALRLNGVPVGGTYESYVLRALEHAWYDLKLDVNDRIAWDVVGVVEGPGTIGEKVIRTVRSAETGLEIGKVEEWPSVACVRIRIIALHAGPVAVGP